MVLGKLDSFFLGFFGSCVNLGLGETPLEDSPLGNSGLEDLKAQSSLGNPIASYEEEGQQRHRTRRSESPIFARNTGPTINWSLEARNRSMKSRQTVSSPSSLLQQTHLQIASYKDGGRQRHRTRRSESPVFARQISPAVNWSLEARNHRMKGAEDGGNNGRQDVRAQPSHGKSYSELVSYSSDPGHERYVLPSSFEVSTATNKFAVCFECRFGAQDDLMQPSTRGALETSSGGSTTEVIESNG
ncbi:hypothetical protein FKW77_009528 [Venturia effusa]|uniref:Uncharacterized protein n=1 Tax=Venturia effusa TaxID=50376 RepID=A0A517L213_9PEZI|nr:hypothetical protein FKW77_009528 [Venturia effusa]